MLALNTFHLLRRLRHCHAVTKATGQKCQFGPQETADLVAKVVEVELANAKSWVWENPYDGMAGYVALQ